MRDLNTLPLPALFEALTAAGWLTNFIERALEEDWSGIGDVTTASLQIEGRSARAAIIARRDGIVSGMHVVEAMTRHTQPFLRADCHLADGQAVSSGRALATIEGPMAAMLAIERTMLNIVGRMSGVATLTRRFVDAIDGTAAVICDTRKTTPCMRNLEKYAVRCGGGTMHRMGLYDAALYKDNHLAGIPIGELAARLTAAASAVRQRSSPRFVEVEVTSLQQLDQVLSIRPGLIDFVLLDNMPAEMMRRAVSMRDQARSAIRLEASGGVTLENVRDIARTGVERISVGAITHSAPVLDIALDVES